MIRAATIIFVLLSTGLFGQAARAADLVRGEMLYRNHCRACHESTVHIREKRKAKTLADIRYWVIRWSTTLGLNWNEETVKDVSRYVNKHYYKYKEKP